MRSLTALFTDMGCKLDESIEHHLGPAALPQDFLAVDLTPDPTYFDDTNAMDPEYGDTEITPEIGYNYSSAELMLPKVGGPSTRKNVIFSNRPWTYSE
jgi:hypothetical protein